MEEIELLKQIIIQDNKEIERLKKVIRELKNEL